MSTTTIPQATPTTQPAPQFASDDRRRVRYTESAVGGRLLRLHFMVARTTRDRSVYQWKHFSDASETDRREAEKFAASVSDLDRMFRLWGDHGLVLSKPMREDRRRRVEFVLLGTKVDDPLVQLELEMMIDLSQGVTT
mgnify:CR=1 FL=1